ncbi:hypothetical protein POM88_024282 [Heracleum sosnowskyi]|uniref:Uncharacterized protein n=1 Tax=Heracleum sosnowskyi TaxID=360622 RepID=A0AAD8MMQ2_9APIA|nr:hypothetical protein POM88_024282 [Heracleum sosnowskyi]
MFGFGWDSVTDDYKLIANPSHYSSLPAIVYSYKTGSWSKTANNVNNLFPVEIGNCCYPRVVVKGIPYWNLYQSREVIKFDVRTNEFSLLEIAPYVREYFSLINMNDCLALREYIYGSNSSQMYRFNEEEVLLMVKSVDTLFMALVTHLACLLLKEWRRFIHEVAKSLLLPTKSFGRVLNEDICGCCLTGAMRPQNLQSALVNGAKQTSRLLHKPFLVFSYADRSKFQATLFLSSFGLLGEYSPSTRIRDKVGCLHFEAHQGYNRNFEGYQFIRPCPTIEEATLFKS